MPLTLQLNSIVNKSVCLKLKDLYLTNYLCQSEMCALVTVTNLPTLIHLHSSV